MIGWLVLAALAVRDPAPGSQAGLAGAWSGTSMCLARTSACRDETVLYRISEGAGGARVTIRVARSREGREEQVAELECGYDRPRATVVCESAEGTWRFIHRGDRLDGGLTGADGTPIRRVQLRRRS